LVVRKRRGLSWQIWCAYQDQRINALIYHPQRTASSILKVYTNVKLQGATWRFKDSIKQQRSKKWLQANKSYPRSLDSSGPRLRAENLLNLIGSFWTY
jgi:hypothetical protein